MAKQTINIGIAANDRKGDSLRLAFQKVNANFNELYAALGLGPGDDGLGAFEFNGSTISTSDSSSIIIDQAVEVSSNLTVGGDILPSVANGGNLGNAAKPFKSLYVSNNTVFLGGVPLSLEAGTNTLKVNNVPISQNIEYTDIPNAPTDVSDLTDNTGLLSSGTGDITFDGVKIIGAGTASGDGNGYSTLELVPDNSLYANDQYLIIDPTIGNPGHIHIRAGGTQDNSIADLFLGGEKIYVRVDDTNGVRINGDLFDSTNYTFESGISYNSAEWSSDGENYFVDITITNPVSPTLPIDSNWNLAFGQFGNYPEDSLEIFDGTTTHTLTYVSKYTLGNPYQLRIQVNESPSVNPTAIQSMTFTVHSTIYNFASLENSDFNLEVSNNVNIFASGNIDLTTGTGPLNIVTNDNNSSYGWTFGDDSKLTLPGVETGTAVVDFFGNASGNHQVRLSNDWTVNIEARADGANEGNLNLTAGVNTGISIHGNGSTIDLVASDGTDTATWTFDKTGGITFPDATVQTSAFTGTGYLTFDDAAVRGTSDYQYTFNTDGYFTSSTSTESPNYFYVANNATNQNIAAGWTVVGANCNTTVSSTQYPVPGYPNVIKVTLTAAASGTSGFYPVAVSDPNRLKVQIQPNPGNASKYTFSTTGITFPDSSVQTTAWTGTSTSLDITDTNGLTTVYYPTFVETRTTGQTVRADVNLTYRTDTNTLSVGNLTTASGGHVELGGATSYLKQTGSQAYIALDTHVKLIPDTNNWAGNGVLIGGNGFVVGPNGSRNMQLNYNNTNGLVGMPRISLYGNESVAIAQGGNNGTGDIGSSSARFNTFYGVGIDLTGTATAGILKINDGIHEAFQSKQDATGTVEHNCASGHVFYHTSPDANWTANFTNLNLSSGYATTVSIVIVQGGTGYYPDAMQIGGVAQTINWQGNATPTPSTNRTDVVSFSIINNSGTYIVLGQLTGF